MSEILLPPGIALPDHIQPIDTPDEAADDETKAGALPTPTGWKMLCVVLFFRARFGPKWLLFSPEFVGVFSLK
jgi:hypothetical protein